jgi:SlyX protein
MESELEKRIVNLESIISYQDQTIEDLNQAVISQSKDIDKLRLEIEKLRAEIQNLREEPDNKPPPHY